MPIQLFHVGFPKTATSAMQRHVFPELARCNKIPYFGKIYPVEVNAAYTGVSRAASIPLTLRFSDKRKIQFTLQVHRAEDYQIIKHNARFIKKGFERASFIYSSETLLSSPEKFSESISDICSRLYLLREAFNPVFLVGVRDPGEWVWSAYRHELNADPTSEVTFCQYVDLLGTSFNELSFFENEGLRSEFISSLGPNVYFFDSAFLASNPNKTIGAICDELSLGCPIFKSPLPIENVGISAIKNEEREPFFQKQYDQFREAQPLYPCLDDLFLKAGNGLLRLAA